MLAVLFTESQVAERVDFILFAVVVRAVLRLWRCFTMLTANRPWSMRIGFALLKPCSDFRAIRNWRIRKMKLWEKWKNRETKKKLRAENAALKELLARPLPHLPVVERDVIAVRREMILEPNIPVEVTKRVVAREMSDYLNPYIEWDVKDQSGKKILSGTLMVAIRKSGSI